jgi:hypothetical protein
MLAAARFLDSQGGLRYVLGMVHQKPPLYFSDRYYLNDKDLVAAKAFRSLNLRKTRFMVRFAARLYHGF